MPPTNRPLTTSTRPTPIQTEGGIPTQRATFTGSIRIRLRVPARLRNLELALLLIACGVVAFAIVLVQLGALGHVDLTVLTLAGGLGILVLVFHVVMRVVAPEADPFILPIATLLNGIGIAEIYRLDIAAGAGGWNSAGIRQIVWTAMAIAIAIAVIIIVRNHRVLQRYRYIAMLVGVVLLLLPMIPHLGKNINGAQVWIQIGAFEFQPGELGKVALAIFFAGYLVTARDSLSMVGRKVLGMTFPRARDLGPILVVFAASMVVFIFQKDLGTSLLYFGLFLVMLYIATGRASWIVLGLGLFALGACAAYLSLDYVAARVHTWLNAFSNVNYLASGGSFQIVQGIFGLAHGGLIGTGLGRGQPQTTPLANSDFIFASLGEELGLVGVFAILALYLLFVSRGLRIGFTGQDDFGRLLGAGLAFLIALQTFIVIGGVTRVIPLTGLTTPFLAAGGSSLVANWIIVALLLRLSDAVRSAPRMVVVQ
jgi:cell division protein FtsW (lipid II flippase)